MSQTFTLDHRQSDLHRDLNANAGEILISAQGDFARGQRRDIAAGPAYGDFATGMRSVSMPRVACDFATGMRTSPRTMTRGDFAIGMRTGAAPVAIDRVRDLDRALPIAA
jgi:hypothetical protein